MPRASRLVCALIAAASAGVGAVVAAVPAGAASCAVMGLQFDPASGGVVLSPSTLTVADGACVTLHNSTITPATFTVGAHYKQTAPAFSDAPVHYVAGPAATTQPVTASGAAGTAKGSIVVKRAAPRPTPSHSTSSPRPRPRTSPTPSHAATSTPPPSPRAQRPTASAPPVAAVSPAPSSTTGPFLIGRPTPSPTPSAPTVVSGPLQPATHRGTGLPAALAALAVVATAGALLRVLLAEPIPPVDGGRSVGAAL